MEELKASVVEDEDRWPHPQQCVDPNIAQDTDTIYRRNRIIFLGGKFLIKRFIESVCYHGHHEKLCVNGIKQLLNSRLVLSIIRTTYPSGVLVSCLGSQGSSSYKPEPVELLVMLLAGEQLFLSVEKKATINTPPILTSTHSICAWGETE